MSDQHRAEDNALANLRKAVLEAFKAGNTLEVIRVVVADQLFGIQRLGIPFVEEDLMKVMPQSEKGEE